MRLQIEGERRLRFDDGAVVRAASAVAPLGDGWLVLQDDSTLAAWVRPDATTRLRVFPAVDGRDVFDEASGTKALKPDVEAACPVDDDGPVLLLCSGSGHLRKRLALLTEDGVEVRDLPGLYAAAAAALQVPLDRLNLEGACVLGGTLRWFLRGNRSAGVPSGSVDVDLDGLLRLVRGADVDPAALLGRVRRYDLGDVAGVRLAVTDAVALPDGRVLVSAAAEDSPNAVDDGPVAGAALALLDDEEVVAQVPLHAPDGRVHKVEGLALREVTDDGVRLLGVVDDDDPDAASVELRLTVTWA